MDFAEEMKGKNERYSWEYAEKLKDGAKELLDGIDIDTEIGQRVIRMIYGFVRRGFLESQSGRKGGATA